MGKKTRAQRNAIRKQGLKEYKQGWKTALKGTGQGLIGVAKGAVDGVTSGRDLASKIAGAVAQGGIQGAQAGSPNIIKGAAMRIKGLAKAIFNDLSWYSNYPELIQGMSGANFSIDDSIEFTMDRTHTSESKPLIATHTIALTNGSSEKIRHMAIQKIYESTRRANSGNVNSTEVNYNDYYIIIRNIVALASELRRGFRLTNKYTSANLAVPNLYLTALGLDAQDFLDNAANIRTYLNQLAQRLEVYVPLNLPIIERTEWMFSHLFADSNDAKAQPHAFVLGNYLHYDVSNQTWAVKTNSVFTLLKSTDIINLIEDEIVALSTKVPAGIIAGDMLKAFGADKLYHFGYTEENDQIKMEYSEEVLTQIQNEVSLGTSMSLQASTDRFGNTYMDITMSAVPGVSTGSAMPETFVRDMNQPQINFYKDQISNVDIIGASRLIISANQTISTNSTNIHFNFGTEVAVATYVFFTRANAVVDKGLETYNVISGSGVDTALAIFKAWATIDWMPRTNLQIDYYTASKSQIYTSVTDVWDYNNSGFLSILSLQAMHEVAYASLFFVPLLSKESNNLVVVENK